METTETRPIKISFPFSLYFEQLFSHDTYVRFINPFSFWRKYKIKHLESCRELNTVQYLESCRELEWRSLKVHNKRSGKNSIKISTQSHPADRQISSTVFVLQPSIELKYRGVSYRTQRIVSVNINSVKIYSDSVKSNNFAQPTNFNETNTPGIFGGNS
jgi:hypothetical protein